MQNSDPANRVREKLEEARRSVATARVAVDTMAEPPSRLVPALRAMLYVVANLVGAIRDGLQRDDLADSAVQHLLSATNALNDAKQRGRWRRHEFAEDLQRCLTELVDAAAIVARVLYDLQPYSSDETLEAVNTAPFMLTVASDALSVGRPHASAADILEGVSLNLRIVIDTADGLRRGLEAATIRWGES